MWPWEHLAFAYLLYSLLSRAARRRDPTGRETVAVAVGSQLPDLVDKPLAWSFEVTETGYAVAHSAFVVPVACLAAYALAVRFRPSARPLAVATSVAALSHLVGDVIYPYVLGRGVEPRAVLWPLASPPADDYGGFAEHVLVYLLRHVGRLLHHGLSTHAAFQIGLLGLVVVVWLADGAPVAAECRRWLADRLRR